MGAIAITKETLKCEYNNKSWQVHNDEVYMAHTWWQCCPEVVA